MSNKIKNTIKSWSLSTLKTYESCPRQLKYYKIDKLSGPPSYALERGMAIHSKMEMFLKGKITGIPYSTIFRLVKEAKIKIEKLQVEFNNEYEYQNS